MISPPAPAPPPAPGQLRSVLVIQTKFLGDLILTEPLVRALRFAHPAARITLLCASGFRAFALAHGLADEVIAVPSGRARAGPAVRAWQFARTAVALNRRRFDLAIDVADTPSTRVQLDLVRAGRRVRYRRWAGQDRLIERNRGDLVADPIGDRRRHFIERTWSVIDAAGLTNPRAAPRLSPDAAAMRRVAELLRSHGLSPGSFVAVHPGASFPGRRWQPERFAAAIDALAGATGLRFALIGGPDDREAAAQVAEVAATPVAMLAGAVPLADLSALLAAARLLLGNESGPMHLAAAVGTPVVGIFGLTDPARWGPLGAPARPVRAPMPCACVAPDLCKPGQPGQVCCVWRVEVETVIAAVEELLAGNRTG